MPTLIPAFALLDKSPSPELVLSVALCDEFWEEVAVAIDVDVDVDPVVPYMTIVKRNPVFHPVPYIFNWLRSSE